LIYLSGSYIVLFILSLILRMISWRALAISMRFWELNKKVEINVKFSNKGVNCVMF